MLYERGVDLVEGRQDPARGERHRRRVPAAGRQARADRGLTGAYYRGRSFEGEPVFTRVDPKVDFRWYRGSPTDEAVARGELPADRAFPRRRLLGSLDGRARAASVGRVRAGRHRQRRRAGDRRRADASSTRGPTRRWRGRPAAKVALEAGREYAARRRVLRGGARRRGPPGLEAPGIRVALRRGRERRPGGRRRRLRRRPDRRGRGRGDARVSYPGFAGGDRTDIALPAIQQKLLAALHATGKPVVLVLTTGSALGLRWAQDNLPAILVAWYPGQQGGTAVADVLFGDANPAGRLPVTFYESVAPAAAVRRLRHGRPHVPLLPRASRSIRSASACPTRGSSTRDSGCSRAALGAAGRLEVSVDVKNTGSRAGDEVVQLYVREAESARPGEAIRTLRGFERISLGAGRAEAACGSRSCPRATSAVVRRGAQGLRRSSPGSSRSRSAPRARDIRAHGTRDGQVTTAPTQRDRDSESSSTGRGWPRRFPSARSQDRRSSAEDRWKRLGQDPSPRSR